MFIHTSYELKGSPLEKSTPCLRLNVTVSPSGGVVQFDARPGSRRYPKPAYSAETFTETRGWYSSHSIQLGYVRVGISTFRLLLGNEASSTVSVAASDVPEELDVVDVVVVMVFR